MKMCIVITLQVEGIHRWAACPIPEVSFLKNFHRHIFHINMVKEVSHDDRDVEIIQLKRAVLKDLNEKFYNEDENCLFLDDWSCERLCAYLIEKFGCIVVKVLEDNENGAMVSV